MELGIKNKIAIVAAASKGLGKATAEALAKEGAKVVIFARNKEELEKTANQIYEKSKCEVYPVAADITLKNDIEKVINLTIQKFGEINILVNNTGGPTYGNFETITEEDYNQNFNLIVLSFIRLIHYVIPYMMKQKWGRIVNIASFTAIQPVDDLIISSIFRPGILSLTKLLSNKYSKFGILTNTVCPGFILTERSEEIGRKRAKELNISFEEYQALQSKDIPLGRYGKPEELANLIAFLCSEKASYITGTAIAVDGGLIKGVF